MDIVIKKPVISEKSMKLAKGGLYTFLVDKKARKPLIGQAVEELFGVKVQAVRTANFKEERKAQKKVRGYFTVPGFKKAYVQLKKGQKIPLFEAEQEETSAETGEGKKVKEKKSLLKGTKVKIEKGEK